MSVPKTKWGNPNFLYTEKVAYQHKVYDFKIPLCELGINDIEKSKDLQVAFAAYGTATPVEEYVHEILINSNSSSGGGVLVEDSNGQVTIPNIDYRVQAAVNPFTGMVLGGSVLKWIDSSSSFETTAWLTEQYPIATG